MSVEKVGEKYRCNICGNEVVVTEVGGGVLVCCDEEMEKIEQSVNPQQKADQLRKVRSGVDL